MEDYFRPITQADIETLMSSPDFCSNSKPDSCLLVPSLPADVVGNVVCTDSEACGSAAEVGIVESGNLELATVVDNLKTEELLGMEVNRIGASGAGEQEEGEHSNLQKEVDSSHLLKEGGNSNLLQSTLLQKEGKCSELSPLQSLQKEGENLNLSPLVLSQKEGECSDSSPSHSMQKDTENSVSMPSSSVDLHWLFGSKHKVLLTSERPSKKRKLLGQDAGLERLVLVGPSKGGSSVYCHACCLSSSCKQSNHFLYCDSCKTCVHQKCYGVQDIPMEGWLCSYCRQQGRNGAELTRKLAQSDKVDSSLSPCVLCPKQGGALKPVGGDVRKIGNSSDVKFAHLFCSLWMPEVYVGNAEMMEPVMNVGEIQSTRRKLVCFLCKVKLGVCIRCSHGTCRTSFHPICARDAKLRMEIWGRVGCDNVELRAFCSKHSGSQDTDRAQESENPKSVTVGSNSLEADILHMTAPVNRSPKIELGCKNRDDSIMNSKNTAGNCDEQNKNKMELEADTLAMRSESSLMSECGGAQLVNMEKPKVTEKNNTGRLILKKLINQGRVQVSDVASELGIPSEALAETLLDEQAPITPELQVKIIRWLQNSAHVGTAAECLKSSNDTGLLFGDKVEPDAKNAAKAVGPDSASDVPLTSSTRRRVKGKLRIVKGKKIVCSSGEACDTQNGNGMLLNEIIQNQPPAEDTKKDHTKNESISRDSGCAYKEPEVTAKASLDCSSPLDVGVENCKDLVQPPNSHDMGIPSIIYNGVPVKMANDNKPEMQHQLQSNREKQSMLAPGSGDADGVNVPQNSSVKSSGEHHDYAPPSMHNSRHGESMSGSHIHPFINKRLIQIRDCLFPKHRTRRLECDGQRENSMSSTKANSCANINCTEQAWHSSCSDNDGAVDGGEGELVTARKMGVLELSPEDEVEGEILYFQNRLLENAVASKHHCEDLIFRVITNLPHELDELRKQRWDAVLINQYLREVREAKKRGRKERRHREAQAVLEAATAAAAASSRISFLRKDAHDEIVTTSNEAPPKVNAVCGRAGTQSQSVTRAKETPSRLGVSKVSSGHSEVFQLTSDFSKEHPLTCDICRRSETILNQVLVCCNCKVSVHLGCYNNLKGTVGPWYCELCVELGQDRSCFSAQCALCNGTTGAFRKSGDGQWVHAFCAEWVLESTFRRGQPNPVGGMEGVLKERDLLVCSICHRKHGVCIKCNYEGCHCTFHPICAKNAGLYMNVKSVGGKFQHKAYCEKHSLEQKLRDETQQYGAEELRSIKQIRVELEKVRLLCERIIKREKLKREFVFCSHDILASKRDSVAFSVLVRSSFFPPDVSSESVTTSIKGHADDTKSCSEAIQRSDDITEDSTASGMCHAILPTHMDIDRKTDDSSTSQWPCTGKPTYKVPFAGKQLPQRPASIKSRNLANNGEKKSKLRKYTETFQKELVMTSDQASMQNQRLPKGFVYVPIGSLPKEKPASHDTGSNRSLEPDE